MYLSFASPAALGNGSNRDDIDPRSEKGSELVKVFDFRLLESAASPS